MTIDSSPTKSDGPLKRLALGLDTPGALSDTSITGPEVEHERRKERLRDRGGRTEQAAECLDVVPVYAPALVPTERIGHHSGESTPAFALAQEKLRRRGPAALTTTDLLIVALGPRTESAVQALLRRHGAAGLSELSLEDLSSSGRLGKGGASRLAALLEFHRRLKAMQEQHRPKISKPAEAYAQVKGIGLAKKEHLVGLYLDTQNGLLHTETISVGSLNTTRSHPREILYPAIQCLAMGFILAHNHPSGCLQPSSDDLEFTRSVRRAGEVMGIELYDHLIVTASGYTSLRETGMIP